MERDVVILGSGFGGSLLGWILAAAGGRAVVVDRDRHPRFAIGESSTPVADLLLADLARRHRLPALLPLARWGSWQEAYPDIGCGKKRGFSYFHHRPGEPFRDTPDHAASLLVAASATDAGSDTHWLRADVDAFLFRQGVEAGMTGIEGAEVTGIDRDGSGWRVGIRHDSGAAETLAAPFLVDATGGGGALARALGLPRDDDRLRTRTGALYTHLQGVGSFDRLQEEAGNLSTTAPFRSDDAAQHHVFDDGWAWMLRFRDDLCSVGFVRPSARWEGGVDRAAAWEALVGRCPSVAALLRGARPVREPALLPRLSRLWGRAAGPGWAMLPTTAGFVDPLHSSGIAHGLSGVARLAGLLLAPRHDAAAWEAYGRAVHDEVVWIDRLVSACYRVLPDFDRFRLAATLFFLATVRFERMLGAGMDCAASGFLAARDAPLRAALGAAADEVERGDAAVLAGLRDRLAPFDPVGLLDPAARHRFAHTAVDK